MPEADRHALLVAARSLAGAIAGNLLVDVETRLAAADLETRCRAALLAS